VTDWQTDIDGAETLDLNLPQTALPILLLRPRADRDLFLLASHVAIKRVVLENQND
jgi:hypothetical protein